MVRLPLTATGLLAALLIASAPAAARDRLLATIDTARIGRPPDAATGSDDLTAVLAAQAARTPASQESAIADAHQTLARFLEGMGATVDRHRLKEARRLFKDAAKALEATLAPVKTRFRRPRPFMDSDAVRPCPLPLPRSRSFPSTHAAIGTLFATLLAHVAPERAAMLAERGRDYGWSRVVCGLHYPTDVAAGRTGGRLVAEALLRDPGFVARLDRAAPELRRSLGLSGAPAQDRPVLSGPN
jgi:acid phosphatase (class A)